MPVPGSIVNFWVQTGNSDNFLSWDVLSTATSYSVHRSTDGITYASIGTPTVPAWLDTTATVNTMYWYKVAGVNGTGTGSYTTPQTIVPTKQGEMNLGELRLRSQQRADRVNSQFIQLPEWNFFINQAYYELYDLLITVYEDYYVAPRLVFNTTGAQSYDLPDGANYTAAPAFYKLFGVDCGLDTSTNAFVTLKKFDFIERNRFVYPQLTSNLLGMFSMRYRLVGNKIMFIPVPSGAQYIGLWYFPRLTTLLQDTDVMDSISGWSQYIIARAAKYALDKEESDTSKLDAEIAFLKDRIETSAMNRDAGQADTISPTRNWSSRWGDGGANGDGSFGGF